MEGEQGGEDKMGIIFSEYYLLFSIHYEMIQYFKHSKNKMKLKRKIQWKSIS